MIKLSHSAMTFFSGLTWIIIGFFLLEIGLRLLFAPFDPNAYLPLFNAFQNLFSSKETAILLTAVALYIGFLKGKHVLKKSAARNIHHIKSLPNPAPIQNMYQWKYYILLVAMIALGISIKYLGIPNDIRGFIDVAIGSALINGAMHYIQVGFQLRKVQPLSEDAKNALKDPQ